VKLHVDEVSLLHLSSSMHGWSVLCSINALQSKESGVTSHLPRIDHFSKSSEADEKM
jgi:hypothetical protein